MRLVYDYQIFQMQNFGGISRYFYELLKQSEQNSLIDSKLGILGSANEYLSEDKSYKTRCCSPRFVQRAYRPLKMVNEFYSLNLIKSKQCDLFHPTFYETYFLNKIKKPYVLTVYDLINEKYPEYFQNNEQFIEKKRQLINGATKVIAISENTKKDIVEYFHVDEKKIEVSYLAESLSSVKSRKIENLPQNYILFTGKRGGYKNFERLYEALVPILQKEKDYHVVCAGGGQFSDAEKDKFKLHGVFNQIHYFSFTTNEELKYFYENAMMFIFPSLYEGFGIPVLESFACDCLTLLSDSSSLKEIGKSGAIYFNPESVGNMREAIQGALINPMINKKITDLANIELKNYSWDKTFNRTLEIYKLALKA